jgi:hypothetical protein
MDTVIASGARIVWIGLPPLRDPERRTAAEDMNGAAADEAAKRPEASYVDLHGMFGADSGAFSPYVRGPSGQMVRVRQEDGVHLTTEGTEWVADLVYGRILADAGVERPAPE